MILRFKLNGIALARVPLTKTASSSRSKNSQSSRFIPKTMKRDAVCLVQQRTGKNVFHRRLNCDPAFVQEHGGFTNVRCKIQVVHCRQQPFPLASQLLSELDDGDL